MAWQLYDDLIDLLPHDIRVSEAISSHWSAVRTDDGGAGVAMSFTGGPRDRGVRSRFRGMPLRDAGALVKSWDLPLAAIGTAAMNSWFNRPERVAQYPDISAGGRSTFALHAESMRGRKVAAVGHFADIDDYRDTCDLVALERSPRGEDLPDPACEYVLPGRDLVYITGSTITNKTLPRLLQLSAGAEVVLVGPSVPFAPEVFSSQVAEIGGSIITDPALCTQIVAAGGANSEFREATDHFNVRLGR